MEELEAKQSGQPLIEQQRLALLVGLEGCVPAGEIANRAEIVAAFGIRKGIFIGVLHHSDGRGPEKPLLYPNRDPLNPRADEGFIRRQVTAQIGQQFFYWGLLREAILMKGNFFNITDLHSGIMLMVSGSRWKRINLGADRDFWMHYTEEGLKTERIFPMEQITFYRKSGFYRPVLRCELGISEELDKETYKSWCEYGDKVKELFHRSIEEVCRQKGWSQEVTDAFYAFSDRENINGVVGLARCLEEAKVDWVWDGDRFYETVMQPLDAAVKETIGKQGNEESELAQALEALTNNLGKMYEQAKEFCGDVYPC